MIRVALGLFLALIPSLIATAQQDYAGRNVTTVKVQGLERVSEQVVRAKLEVQPGQPYNSRAIARDIRRLYELGFFTKIRAEAATDGPGVAITYITDEKRVIGELKIVGNKKIKERKIRGALTMHEGDSFVAEGFDEERAALVKLYATKGFASTTIDVSAEKIGPSRVGITYTIKEGPRARIRSIEFEGNQALSRRQLHKVMKTRKAYWFIGGRLEDDKLETDLQAVLDAYGNVGRLESQIVKTDVQFIRGGKGIALTIGISEGPVYHVKDMKIAGNTVFDTDEVMKTIEVKPNAVHNKGQVIADSNLVQKGYQDSGYVNAKVTPQVVLDRQNKTTAVVHQIDEGDLKYIREVNVTGNATTKDQVVRRDVTLKPGERFDGSQLEATRRRLENTRFFEKVRLTLNDDQDNDRYTNLLADVDEGKPGLFNFGAGLNSQTGIGGFTEVRLTNFDIANWKTFSGGGQQLRLRAAIGTKQDSYTLSFTDPEFLGYPLSFGADLYKESTTYQHGSNYTEDTLGGQIRIGKALSENLTARVAFGAEDTTLKDKLDYPHLAKKELRDQRGSSLTISTQGSLERNTLDRTFDPTKGSRHTISTQVAGFGGDNYFVKVEQESIWYWPLSSDRKWVLSYEGRTGVVTAYGPSDRVPIQDRLYVGGTNTVRGYHQRDIGPQTRKYSIFGYDFGTRYREGGNWRALSNLEIKYKVNDLLRLYAFWDAGGTWEYFKDFDLNGVKNGVGLGIGFDVPRFGPIRLDYGVAVNPDKDQGRGELHFSSGFKF